MKKSMIIAMMGLFVGTTTWAACPESNSTMEVVEGKRQGQTFCAIRSTNSAKPAVISKDTTFESDKLYILGSGLYVGSNEITTNEADKITLTIEPGTKILGQSASSYMQINRGAKIVAEGTAKDPILFTTTKTSNRTRGSWGGLIINGNAPVNGCTGGGVCELKGEGLTSYKYGGPKADDNSGVLKYVVVEFAGNEITPDNELNGIAFQGVGNKTEVDYIQVHMNADDGVEFFGGTVNVKHVFLTGNKDDSMDWTNGWTGSAQYVIVEQYEDAGNNGIEADNNGDLPNAEPRSNPVLANMTFIGTSTSKGAKGGSGLLLRRGTGAAIYNSYITGFSTSCVDFDDIETFNNAKENNGIVFENTFFNCSEAFTNFEENEPFAVDNYVMSQKGNKLTQETVSGYLPTTIKVSKTQIPGLDATDYVGAMKDASDDWFARWTVDSKN